jgi:SAM-dependent methyltransferase
MSKENEIAYLTNIAKILDVSPSEVEDFHMRKPFADNRRGNYLIDIGQILMMLPPPPARILDLGVGSGWTSEMLAYSGYSVLGLDISPEMIALSKRRITPNLDLQFEVHDYEESIDFGLFDAVVIYDALHHAIDESKVIANVFHGLKPGGIFITIEPGVGHSTSPESLWAMEKFGTTEKDMEYARQAELMVKAGFRKVRQHLRLSYLPLKDIATKFGNTQQLTACRSMLQMTANGYSSLVIAVKADTQLNELSARIASAKDGIRLLQTTRAYRWLKNIGWWHNWDVKFQQILEMKPADDVNDLQSQFKVVEETLQQFQSTGVYQLHQRLGRWEYIEEKIQEVLER